MTFIVAALILSGYRLGRAIAWGLITLLLLLLTLYTSVPFRVLCALATFAWFFAGAMSPAFRARWFGQRIE